MNSSVELHDILPLRLENLRRYLLAVGWRQLKLKEDVPKAPPYDAYRFGTAHANKAQIILPSSTESMDWQHRIRDAVQTLRDIEDRSPAEVIHSIQRIGYDIVRSAIPEERVKDDTILLTAATEFISNMRALLATTATTEKRPMPYFGRLLKESVQFADTCRFGHTFRSSFGFVVESPLPEPDVSSLFPDSPPVPFERRVIQRLARGMESVVAATARKDPTPITSSVATGLSANSCEQLAELIESVNPSGLRFSFDLSPAWGVARDMDAKAFSIDASHAEICRAAARELRRADAVIPATIFGRVVRLQNQTDPTDFSNKTGEHEIAVVWASEDLGDILVRIALSPSDYLAAVAAHGAGQPIRVSGELTKVGRQWFLSQPQDFGVQVQGELPFENGNPDAKR